MPIIDNTYNVRTTAEGAFVSSVPEHYHAEIFGTGAKGLALHVRIPAACAGVPILFVNIHASSTSAAATTDYIITQRQGMLAGAEYVIPFTTRKRAVAFMFDTSSTTTATFSIITADIIENVGVDWTRDVEFI